MSYEQVDKLVKIVTCYLEFPMTPSTHFNRIKVSFDKTIHTCKGSVIRKVASQKFQHFFSFLFREKCKVIIIAQLNVFFCRIFLKKKTSNKKIYILCNIHTYKIHRNPIEIFRYVFSNNQKNIYFTRDLPTDQILPFLEMFIFYNIT